MTQFVTPKNLPKRLQDFIDTELVLAERDQGASDKCDGKWKRDRSH